MSSLGLQPGLGASTSVLFTKDQQNKKYVDPTCLTL